MERQPLIELLRQAGLLQSPHPLIVPLAGGVSSEIVRVEDGDRTFVVKRALARLRVRDEWRADPGRTRFEHRYLAVAGRIVPGAVPRVLHVDDEQCWFAMEWFGEGWRNWKADMLGGAADTEVAAASGGILGAVHRETAGSARLSSEFDAVENFAALRLEPYLLATGSRHPDLEPLFRAEAERLRSVRECLVHGDYSPKNLLVRDGRVVVLDCEVAWYGDPAFDLAFLLNHLHLKALLHAPRGAAFAAVCQACADAYWATRGLPPPERVALEERAATLLLLLMLARIDGKSPVEYLEPFPEKRGFVRRFVATRLSDRPPLAEISRDWFTSLADMR